jgi:hypothetical protein
MSIQILTLELDGITACDYLTWCRDPDPPALDNGLRSIRIDADPLGDTITAILDWNQPALAPVAAATTAGLPLSPDVQIHPPAITEMPRGHGDRRLARLLDRRRREARRPSGAPGSRGALGRRFWLLVYSLAH